MSEMTHWNVEFRGEKYSVTHYGINACHGYEDVDGEHYDYTAPMVHFEGEIDLPLDMTLEQARGISWNAACCCGYSAPSVDWNDMSITVYGDYKAYQVWYGKEGGIIDIKNVTLDLKIESLESEIRRMKMEWGSAMAGDIDTVHGLSLTAFGDWITDKELELKELQDVQNSNG